ncbi:antitoxin [Enterococcus avium]|uniref:FitA-like ribbon-helix-helix domain-containing protein n=1 Tax=Enterococcus TaxID=1350 RepID=UPI001A9658C4|nr:antitoxin [Enterococcus avium]MBO1139842.1 antitoxin [Enterococcus avium]
MSTILIRNIPAKTIAALDEWAQQNSQSREEYIRRLLEHHVMYSEVEGLNKKYETLVHEISQNMILALNENTKALNEFIDIRKENSQ